MMHFICFHLNSRGLSMARTPNTTSIAAILGVAIDQVPLVQLVDDNAVRIMLKEFDRQVQEIERRKQRPDVQPL